MGTYEQMDRVVKHRKEKMEERDYGVSHERLMAAVKKKVMTIIIGEIDRCEKAFGYLWAHGKPGNQLSEAQLEWRRKWELIRTDMLNHGNGQLRALLSEVDMYEVMYSNYNYELPKI